jgi:hypothetical protein
VNQKTIDDGYTRLSASIERLLGPEWNKRSGTRQTGHPLVFSADSKPTVQVIWKRKAAVVHVVVLPPDGSQGGIVRELPKLPEFFHP